MESIGEKKRLPTGKTIARGSLRFYWTSVCPTLLTHVLSDHCTPLHVQKFLSKLTVSSSNAQVHEQVLAETTV